ncbi:MaoC family dehydratase [Pseudonocardia kunmingensis]|uniref:Acyl dehydratase n=1 Tax=Pseudonocardia kunmingensis TaxID=630975 RepID=A0A543E2M9_9PSEU|nr:MaoC/PaaZ C-terminal domain-containing protein [Pseudonocardia kunmingensis]TQM15864.1 acyl dehydratase [Pseudonocardia kunmingensis]
MPTLGPLYVKAALGTVGRRGADLPETVLAREGVTVDRDRLAEYARVCGLPVADALPATYPHVLAFPLQVELMAQRSFPLPLPGLVHVRNGITLHRAVDAAEPLAVRVHAEGLRAHPKGAQVDLVARVDAGGEAVWEGRSTYLARGATATEGAADTPAPPGVDAGAPAATWRVDAGTGRRYARVSGDVNPIHLSKWTAKAFGFPRAIAHGMWTAARVLAALQGRLPEALTYDVAFGRPLLLPSMVELRTARSGDGWDVEVRGRKGPHLTATLRPTP